MCVYVCMCVCVIFLQLAPDTGSDASKQGFCYRSFLEDVGVCVDMTAGCGDSLVFCIVLLFSPGGRSRQWVGHR